MKTNEVKIQQESQKHIDTLFRNLNTLKAIQQGAEYPSLRALLLGYRGSLMNRLEQIHRYRLEYLREHAAAEQALRAAPDEEAAERATRLKWKYPVAWSDGRGIEIPAAQDVLIKKYGGSKSTWRKAINRLCALGLLGQYRPRMDRDEALNTPDQMYSAERAKRKAQRVRAEWKNAAELNLFDTPPSSQNVKPVTWYRVPEYTPELLRIAENKAEAVRKGAANDKNAMRDEFGEVAANRITDTGYTLHPDEASRRAALDAALAAELDERGYTTTSDLMQRAAALRPDTDKRWKETWNGYRKRLFDDNRLKRSQPTKEEKRRFNLDSNKHIIRRRS